LFGCCQDSLWLMWLLWVSPFNSEVMKLLWPSFHSSRKALSACHIVCKSWTFEFLLDGIANVGIMCGHLNCCFVQMSEVPLCQWLLLLGWAEEWDFPVYARIFVSHWMNFESIISKSDLLFCNQYLWVSPMIRPFRQLGGCAEPAGIYKYKVICFWNDLVLILEFEICRVRSRKLVTCEGSSISHSSLPQLLSVFLNDSQVLKCQ